MSIRSKIKKIFSPAYYKYRLNALLSKLAMRKYVRAKIYECEFSAQYDRERGDWEHIFLTYIRECPASSVTYFRETLKGFFEEKLSLLFQSENMLDGSSVILVCSTKNDLTYLRRLLPYYRDMGIKNFVFVDNGSTDGSVDFLKTQPDTTVFSSKYSFDSRKIVGWKLQLIAHIGLNHWYLWLDSDEFFSYPHMEEVSIQSLTEALERKGLDHLRGFMLDMYPRYEMMDGLHEDDRFFDDYVYFDAENRFYHLLDKALTGGMRGRLMGLDGIRLDKIPLAYCKRDLLFITNHNVTPKAKQKEGDFGCVLRHYKFLPSDSGKYRVFADNDGGGHANKNIHQRYADAKEQGALYAMCGDSVQYTGSEDLMRFSFMRDYLSENYAERTS